MTDWWPDSLSPEAARLRSSPTLSPETPTPGVTVWIDAYVEAWAEAFDSVSLGLGDVLRDFYQGCIEGERMKLNWKSYGDNGRVADGDQGKWRIVTDGIWWHLTVQPKFTRGMVSRGKFDDRARAMEHAQKCEGDAPILPLQITASHAPKESA